MAYGQLYDCKRMILLYPHHNQLSAEEKWKNCSIASKDNDRQLIVATIDVAAKREEVGASLASLVDSCVGQLASA